jgi:hypothetical protein
MHQLEEAPRRSGDEQADQGSNNEEQTVRPAADQLAGVAGERSVTQTAATLSPQGGGLPSRSRRLLARANPE